MRYLAYMVGAISIAVLAGCGTTRMSDTSRTATEQLLLSTAVDQAINEINFKSLSGKDVYLDAQYLKGIVDESYIVSSLRQHLLSYGCVLKEDRKDATYVVEARAGAVGTNRHDVLIGVPAINLPVMSAVPAVPSAIPEIPFAKTTDQKGIAKIAVFAYNRQTGRPVWQSGVFPVHSTAKDTWILGTGPFQRGTIYDGTRFAGSRLLFSRSKVDPKAAQPAIPVTAEAVFEEKPAVAQKGRDGLTMEGKPQAAGAGGQPPGQVTEATEPADVVPAGHIIRLPPLEQAARRDLDISHAAPREAPPGENPPQRFSGESPHRIDEGPRAPESDGFDIFRPGTWFRTTGRPEPP